MSGYRNPALEIRGPFTDGGVNGISTRDGRSVLAWPTAAEEEVMLKALNRAWRKQERERAAAKAGA
ncbi:hypothetical protein ACYQR9_21675 [Methylobacterium sp. CM6241]